MQSFNAFYCIVSPPELAQVRSYPVVPCLYAYQVQAGARLHRSCGPTPVRGGLLAVTLSPGAEEGAWEPFCRQCVLECRSRGASGMLADWSRFSRSAFRFTRALGQQLERSGLSLLVPEAYAGVTAQAGVLISTALSGGSLEVRLTEALERYGAERVVLALERMSDDFTLPAPAGRGRRLTVQQLSLLRQRRPGIYWSGDLCARYFTYRDRDGVHFVLFDDETALRKKLELARRLGVQRSAAAWAEISDCAGALLQ